MKKKQEPLKKGETYENGGYAQNGLGFDAGDPYFDHPALDPSLDAIKSAGSAFLGNKISSQAYFDWLYPNDKAKAKSLSQRSALISGAIGGLSALNTQYGEVQDYKRNQQYIAKHKAKDYYRVPFDRYSYNENLVNPYNQTAYGSGGQVKGMYQDGGSTYPEGFEPDDENTETYKDNETPNQQVVFDSTQGAYPEQSNDVEGTYEDSLPYDEDGAIDFSKITPTLGDAPLRMAIGRGDVSSVIDQIATHESGGNYSAVNTSGGEHALNATGKYQFVPKYWAGEIAKFQGTVGRTTEETMNAFKSSPVVQDAFMRHVVDKFYLPEVKNLLPLAKKYGIDQGGLIKMLHYRGTEDTRRRLQSGDFTVSRKEKTLYNNPDILQYIKG
jgi:hypothetical protein